MKLALIVAVVVAIGAIAWASAAPPYHGPKGGTAECEDGTISYSAHYSGTCSWHGGVKAWNHTSLLDRILHQH